MSLYILKLDFKVYAHMTNHTGNVQVHVLYMGEHYVIAQVLTKSILMVDMTDERESVAVICEYVNARPGTEKKYLSQSKL